MAVLTIFRSSIWRDLVRRQGGGLGGSLGYVWGGSFGGGLDYVQVINLVFLVRIHER